MSRRVLSVGAWVTMVAVAITGCTPSRPFYFFNDGDLSHYRGVATEIEYPDVESARITEVEYAQAPLTLANAEAREMWDLTLQEAVQTALTNAKVMRSLGGVSTVIGQFGAGSVFNDPSNLTRQPLATATAYDPAIAESSTSGGSRFGLGTLGPEAALSAFDAQFNTSMFWQRNHVPRNIAGVFAGFQPGDFQQDTASNLTQLSKSTATGGHFILRNFNNYDFNNNGSNRYSGIYNVGIETEFRHHLLAGAGAQYTRIAGPTSNNATNSSQPGFSGMGNPLDSVGIYRGVAIARINQDIALADLEAGVRNLVNDIENAYWSLYFRYRDLDAKVVGRDSALLTWRKIYALYQNGAKGGEAEKEAQAREQYFLFRGQVESSLSDLYASENQLRYLMGLTATDGRLIRPADEPTTARVQFDWNEVHAEALARSIELRQQKWRIKQHELQLLAAKSLLLPQLDFDALYRFRGLGNQLAGGQPFVAADLTNPYTGAYRTLAAGGFQDWQVGLVMSMPLGMRLGMAAVRNEQLWVARERAMLQDQELELSHQLSNAIRKLERFYTLSQTNFNRRIAAQKQVDAVRAAYETETVTLDLLLDAQRRLAEAESQYFDSLANYNLAIAFVHYKKGSLLEYDGVYMAEGPWADKAYFDAQKRARARDSGLMIDYGFSRPAVFSRGPIPQDLGANPGYPASGTAPTPPAGGEEVPAPAPQREPQPEAENPPAAAPSASRGSPWRSATGR